MKKGILIYDKKDSEYNSWFIKKLITEGAKEGLVIELVLTEDIIGCGSGDMPVGLQTEALKSEALKPEIIKSEILELEASKSDILKPEIVKQDALRINLEEYKDCDFAILRNRSAAIAEYLEQAGVRCFNSSSIVRLGNDKWAMHEFFKSNNIPQMHTQTTRLPFPFVLKPRSGHGGKNVYLINNNVEYQTACQSIWEEYNNEKLLHNQEYNTLKNHRKSNPGGENFLDEKSNADGKSNPYGKSNPDAEDVLAKKINPNQPIAFAYENVDDLIKSEYIYQLKASETGRDIRVYILGDNIMTAMERISDNDFRANFSLGGKACEYALTSDEMMLAAKAAELLKPNFIGIDIIYNNGHPVINEIEDAVGTRMLYQHTDIDAAAEYIRYINSTCLKAW